VAVGVTGEDSELGFCLVGGEELFLLEDDDLLPFLDVLV
jgi:hypothetical protein